MPGKAGGAFFGATRRFAGANTVSLREEMAQLQRYMDLQKLRFGSQRLRYQTQVPERFLDSRLPPFSLLNLAENTVDHGMKDTPAGITLRVEAEARDGRLVLSVLDDGCGILPEHLARFGKQPVASQNPSGKGSGEALYLVCRGLEMAFPGQGRMAIDSGPGRGTHVVLSFPNTEGR